MSKSKSFDKLHEESTYEIPKSSFTFMKNGDKIPSSPNSITGSFNSSLFSNHKREFSEPILQSTELFHTLIDSPCSKFEKIQFNNALSSATKYLLNRHLESVNHNTDIFKENVYSTNKNYCKEFKIPQLTNLHITPNEKTHKVDCQTQTSNTPSLIEEIEQQKKNEIEVIRQTKLQCCDSIKTQFKEIELEIEKTFGILENKVIDNYNKLLKKVSKENNDSDESQDKTVITVEAENSTRMTGAFGVLNNFNKGCSFLKTPKTKKSKTMHEEILNNGTLTPNTMSFVLHEQLMHLNSNS